MRYFLTLMTLGAFFTGPGWACLLCAILLVAFCAIPFTDWIYGVFDR